jgi:hypothetical protein
MAQPDINSSQIETGSGDGSFVLLETIDGSPLLTGLPATDGSQLTSVAAITLNGDIAGTGTGDLVKLVTEDGSPLIAGLPVVGGFNLTSLPSGVLTLSTDMSDVVTGGLVNGHLLQYAGGIWSNVPESTVGGGITLNNLSDVNVGFPAGAEDKYVVQWNGVGSPMEFVLEAVPYEPLTINTQAGTAYTLVLADAGVYVRMTNAAANTVTVPANVDVAFEIGTEIIIRQAGAGATTLASPGSPPVIINSPDAGSPISLTLTGQHNSVSIIKVATDEWDLIGAVV